MSIATRTDTIIRAAREFGMDGFALAKFREVVYTEIKSEVADHVSGATGIPEDDVLAGIARDEKLGF